MNKSQYTLTSLEKKSIASLASVFGLRMFGLFLILPVLSVYAEQLSGATPTLMGLALGIYGFTQALLQIPFGILSDRFGRKKMIVLGLLIFCLGGLIAAASNSIMGVILGRALQGAGAIASVILALASDLTRENQRTKAMAFIGISIGLSFLLALIAAPILEQWVGVKGLFILTSVLSLFAILIIVKVVPTPVQSRDLNVRAVPKIMLSLLKHPQLIRLNIGIFILHFTLMAMFVVVPILLTKADYHAHWKVYLPALLGSLVFMTPMIMVATRKSHVTMRIFMAAVCILLLAQCLFMWRPFGVTGIMLCLFFFFWGFNLLESMLPSLISRVAPAATRGSAMGVYNTFQFIGVFLGGLIGGWVYGRVGYEGVFAICGALLVFWVLLLQTGTEIELYDNLVVTLPNKSTDWEKELLAIQGVHEVSIVEDGHEQQAYLKINKKSLDQVCLDKLLSHS